MARRYARRGDSLYLLARNRERLDALAQELGPCVRGSRSADFDVTSASSDHIEAAAECLGGLDIAVIAHGQLGDQVRSEADYPEAERILRSNLLSSVSLLIALANHFESARRDPATDPAHIALLSSVASERGRPRNYTYGAAKAALNVYLQGLRSRLYGAGVQVHVIKLGPVDTPMTEDHVKNPSFSKPQDVARTIVRAIDRGRREVYVPGFWRPVMFVVRHMPEAIFQRLPFLSGR